MISFPECTDLHDVRWNAVFRETHLRFTRGFVLQAVWRIADGGVETLPPGELAHYEDLRGGVLAGNTEVISNKNFGWVFPLALGRMG